MNKRLKIFLLMGMIILLNSCKLNINSLSSDCESKFPILDSIGYTVFPNDNFGTSGNSVFKKIKNKGEQLEPCLLELIKDTSKTQIRVADAYNYKKSDLAILILPYVSDTSVSLRELLFDEFKKEFKGKNKKNDFYSSLHHFIFFSNSNEVNYRNRIRFYKRLKNNN